MRFYLMSELVNDRPIDEAIRASYIRHEVRTVDDPAKLYTSERETWYQQGKNHRLLENGWICRDFERVGWFLEVNTLDELYGLLKKYGGPLFLAFSYDHDELTLELSHDCE